MSTTARFGGYGSSAAMLALSGCAMRSAPSFPIVGAYFPAWMLCSLLGILGTILVRAAFTATGLDELLPLRFFVYVSIGIIIGLVLWIVWFQT